MNSRKLILRDGALRDIARHEHHLGAVRGIAFAEAWSKSLLDGLENRAALGAQFVTVDAGRKATEAMITAKRRALGL